MINLIIHQTNPCLTFCFSEQAATSPGPQAWHHAFHFSTCPVHSSLSPGDPSASPRCRGPSLRVSIPAGLPASHLPSDSHLKHGVWLGGPGSLSVACWRRSKASLGWEKCCSDLAWCGCHEKTPLIFSFWECNWWPQTPSASGLQHHIHRALLPQASPS